jgi:hypothetical protein
VGVDEVLEKQKVFCLKRKFLDEDENQPES